MALCVGCVVLLGGCHLLPQGKLARSNKFKFADDAAHYQTVAREIEYPKSDTPENPDVANTLPPRTLLNPGDLQYWDLTLEDAFRMALANNTVIRDVGGRVVTAPVATATPLDPAIIESDPRSGVEAALSAFDAQLDLSTFWNKDDRVFNSSITQSFTGSQSDRALGQIEVNKITASGTQVAVRNVTDYAQFESFFNRFDSYYNTIVETEIRHPFLQGGGLDFNRIAGPNAVPGAYNGVVLARINTDISLADFESAIIGLTQNIEQTYWALYAAYRDLDARIAARNNALQTWRSTYRRLEVGAGDAEEESAAREQFWAFQGQVDNALSGSTNVSAGFLTPTQGGILAREAQFGNFWVCRRTTAGSFALPTSRRP